MQFEDYCKFRSSMQMQLLINGKSTKIFTADDQMFAGLILMEHQWQYASRVPSVPQFNRGLQFPNVSFNQNVGSTSSGISSFNFHQTLNEKVTKSRRSNGQKRRIKKYEGKPKKPLTSFMLFLKDFRQKLNESHPSETKKTSPHEINKLAGKQWHLLPEKIKNQYKTAVARALSKWQQENFMSQTTSVKTEIKSPSHDVEKCVQGTSNITNHQINTQKTENSSAKRLTDTSSSSDSSSSSGDSSGSESECSSN